MAPKVKGGAKAKAKAVTVPTADWHQQLGPGGGWACGVLRDRAQLPASRVRTPGGRGARSYPSTA